MSGTNANSIARVYDSLQGRNVIINGNCNIAQRSSLALPSTTTGYGGPDRYIAINFGAGGQFTQSQGSITFSGITKNAVVQTVNTAPTSIASTNYWYGIVQRIEGYNCYHLLGQTISLSFIFNTNVTGTYSVAISDNGGTNSYVTTFTAVANTPTKYTFNIPTLSISLNVPNSNAIGLVVSIGSLNTGTYNTSTLNVWQSGNLIAASGLTNWGASASNFIAVTELQLEQGSIATPFERENYAITLHKCQRYYTVLSSYQVTGYAAGAGNTTTASITLPSAMRATPTVAQTSTSQNNCTGMTVNPQSPQVSQTFGIAATAATNFYAQATLLFSSEL